MKEKILRIGMAQVNVTVGDLEGNTRKIKEFTEKAKDFNCDIVTFPELALTGYPPEDLLLKPRFVKDNLNYLKEIIEKTRGIVSLVGFVDGEENKIYNACALISGGELKGVYHKILLPNYGVFDEKRYFHPGERLLLFILNEVSFSLSICEDIWDPEGPVKAIAKRGAQIILVINASPFHAGRGKERLNMLIQRAKENHLLISYNNLVGGQDELVFDGWSVVVNQKGEILAQGKPFEEDLVMVDLPLGSLPQKKICPGGVLKLKLTLQKEKKTIPRKRRIYTLSRVEEIYKALVLGLKDYVRKNGFKKVIVGLSGGIDSSLTATISVDALGRENVMGVFMPSRYTTPESEEDAKLLTQNLGINLIVIPIDRIFESYLKTLEPEFRGLKPDVAEENLQARIRGNILMALSNKFGWLVLTTGNKSEVSCGYCTLYGDTAGGFAVIKDVPKTMVYKLARYRNALEGRELIPPRVLQKPPSAELRSNQKDTDTLPPYEILDPILKAYVEEDKSFQELVLGGWPEDLLLKIIRMVDRNEYKRRQSPPGIKITPRAFGKDRRMPITNRYQG